MIIKYLQLVEEIMDKKQILFPFKNTAKFLTLKTFNGLTFLNLILEDQDLAL